MSNSQPETTARRDNGHKKQQNMKRVVVVSIAILFASCTPTSYKYGAESENSQKSNLTTGVVKTKLIKGETTQDEVLKLFGAPNIISKNKANNEVWSYNKMSTQSKAGASGFWDGPRASVSSSSSSFDLIVTFRTDNIVLDYSIISTSF